MELTSNSPTIPNTASPSSSGGSKNGIKVMVPIRWAALDLRDLSQLPKATPIASDSRALTTAMIAVVRKSSKLVVKNV
jgi:hypothetical protein